MTEIVDALALERGMDKTKPTTYLNVSPFGRNNRGQNIVRVAAAAQGIFGVLRKTCLHPQEPLSLACHRVRLSTHLMLQTEA